jgi:hypothetical protein
VNRNVSNFVSRRKGNRRTLPATSNKFVADEFGPWAGDLSRTERRLRWRTLAALSLVSCGGSHSLLRSCLEAEAGTPGAAAEAWSALLSLAPLIRRRLLSGYIALMELIDAKPIRTACRGSTTRTSGRPSGSTPRRPRRSGAAP